ncbi:Leucine-rich repeat domain, L domain-like [Phytophthora cactorum]|nr:Leucine-rich repeat domain, L domain-like [Phytophthora cactorum]
MKDETPRHSVSRRLSPALKEEEIRPAAVEAPRQPAKLKPRPPPVSTSRDSSPAESKTFLTALVPAGRRQNEALRPPSPLESLEPSSDYVDTGGALEPPEPANYMGMEAMQQFWGIFHRQETVHNNKAVPPTVSSVVARPKSARTNYLAAVRNLRLCPEPLGIVRRRVVDKTASYASGSTTQEVNLSSYRMGNAYAAAFGEGFSLLPGVESLNLSHNRIGDIVAARLITAAAAGMLAVARFLEENSRIEELYLAWNQLRGVGALKIVEALKYHASLRVCDLSWNALSSSGPSSASGTGNTVNNSSGGVLRPRAVVTALADSLANNKVLAHLDLSSNRLDLEDCTLLAKQLENNQTLIGLHMSGNCAVMDSRGFLIPKAQAHDEEGGGSRRLRDQHKLYSVAIFEEVHSDAGSGVFPPHLMSIVRLHLSVDDWRGVAMERRENDGDGVSFSALRVIPPGATSYFFTVADTNAGPNSSTNASYHYVNSRPSRPVQRQRRLIPGKYGSLRESEEAETAAAIQGGVFATLERLNVLRLTQRGGRDPCNTLVPRSSGKNNGRRGKWDINKSVFARRKRESECRSFVDTDGFITKACAADWKQCKIDRFVKDPIRRREVEVSVTRWYRTLQNDVTCVPWPGYTEFLSEAKILDESSEYCSLPDLENVFVAANLELTQEAKEKDNPDRSLTRFEFLECIIRIATNKYFRKKYQVFCDSFRVRDVKDPFLACKLMVLDEMTTVGHKKLYLTDFMEIILRVSVLRYPARTLTVDEVVRSLHKLLVNHFYKHDALVGQFCEAIDQALVKDRLEAFANAINSQRNHPKATATSNPRNRGGGRSAGAVQRAIIAEESASDTDEGSELEGSGHNIASNATADSILKPEGNSTEPTMERDTLMCK